MDLIEYMLCTQVFKTELYEFSKQAYADYSLEI